MLCVAVGVGMNGPEHGGVADDVHGRNPNLKRGLRVEQKFASPRSLTSVMIMDHLLADMKGSVGCD